MVILGKFSRPWGLVGIVRIIFPFKNKKSGRKLFSLFEEMQVGEDGKKVSVLLTLYR